MMRKVEKTMLTIMKMKMLYDDYNGGVGAGGDDGENDASNLGLVVGKFRSPNDAIDILYLVYNLQTVYTAFEDHVRVFVKCETQR